MKKTIIIIKYPLLLLVFIIFVFSLACNTRDQKNTIKTPDANLEGLPGDFTEFYERFHVDSAFQMKHIVFPLESYIRDQEDDNVYIKMWTEENWIMHRRFDPSDQAFDQDFQVLSSSAVKETISALDGLFRMERRFAKLSDGWHLIYYYQQ